VDTGYLSVHMRNIQPCADALHVDIGYLNVHMGNIQTCEDALHVNTGYLSVHIRYTISSPVQMMCTWILVTLVST